MTRPPTHPEKSQEQFRRMASAIRFLAVDAIEKAGSGHPGMPLGMADAAAVLFSRFLKFDPRMPDWPDRDRFVLSAGHGSMLLYSLLHLTGYADFPIEDLKRFRQLGSRAAGHPEYGLAAGIETTTGPLGQGLATAVGMALAEANLRTRFGEDLCDHHTYVIAGDGCLMEGISQEAISLAGHWKLDRLIVLWDDNGITIDGSTRLATSDDTPKRFEASGWTVDSVDGGDPEAIATAIERARQSDRPSLIACRTQIGFGAGSKAGTSAIHGSPVGAEGIAQARDFFAWPYEAFEIPPDVAAFWKQVGGKGAEQRTAWEARLAAADASKARDWRRVMTEGFDGNAKAALSDLKARLVREKPALATRKASLMAIEALSAASMKLVGGSADLSGSNLTKPQAAQPIGADDYAGTYIHFGIREHAMAAIMNGLALHGGFLPFGGTFLCFADYARPAIRLSALMRLPVVYVMTHDSIGQGEDGPTHQPIEHLASLRAMPGLRVMRPADAVETAECWEAAVDDPSRPTVLVLSRQALRAVRTTETADNLSRRGAYVLAEADGGRRDITILATGSEVEIALDARTLLAGDGIAAAVVSMPCWDLFQAQSAIDRQTVLGDGPRIAIEAASPFGWTRYVDDETDVIALDDFGASAPGPELFRHFGLTAEAVAAKARSKIAGGVNG